jgi:hypothetical protein
VGQPDADHRERFLVLLHAVREVDAEEPDLDRRDATADPEQKAASAHLVEHADLLDQPQRVIERQQIHHRPEAQALRPLRDGGQKHARRRGVAEWGRVVLGEMVAVKTRAIVGFGQLQALLEQLAERDPAVVQMIEDPKAHQCLPSLCLSQWILSFRPGRLQARSGRGSPRGARTLCRAEFDRGPECDRRLIEDACALRAVLAMWRATRG